MILARPFHPGPIQFGAALVLGLCVAGPAAAADDPRLEAAPLWDVEAAIDVVSDYRYRGLSLSGKRPAFQPSLTVTHRSGIYADFWASNYDTEGGSDLELDFKAGVTRPLGPFELDLSASLYVYPGVPGSTYVELDARAALPLGEDGELGLAYGWAPPQDNTGGISNHYAGIDASVPLAGTALTLTGSFGYEDGAFAAGKLDWSIGLGASVEGFDLNLAYVDTARSGGDPLGDATAVLTVSRSF